MKYKSIQTEVDKIKFGSKLEAGYYERLMLLKKAGEIIHFDLQPVFTLPGNIRYRADFLVYYKSGEVEAVDTKGLIMADFKIKRKLFDIYHPLRPLQVIKGVKKKGVYCFKEV